MKSRCFVLSLVAVWTLSLSACSPNTPGSLSWGVGGALAGAGTGALVGSLITSGDVVASAGLGSVIGFTAGALVGLARDRAEIARVQAIDDQLQTNEELINERQRQIDSEYERIREQSQSGELDESLAGQVYDGPTIGVPGR